MMISAIARILGIGEKVDMMVILEGPQGLLKSTAVRTLFYPWFTDDIEQFGSKDASMQCAGVWCIEVGELDAISKTEASRIKSFISRFNDRFRPPYGKRIIERPRSCIFIGTTNCNDYLKDWTGARRFLPVSVIKIDIEGLQRDRDMLWAEARILYEAGVAWWFTDSETGKAAAAKAELEQEGRFQADPWEPLIANYLESRLHQPPDYPAYRILIEHVFKNAIGLDEVKWDQAAMNRVARCMKRLGWKRKQLTVEIKVQGKPQDKRVWFYVRPPTKDELVQDARQKEIDARKKAAETEPGSNITTLKQLAPAAADAVVMQETAVPQA